MHGLTLFSSVQFSSIQFNSAASTPPSWGVDMNKATEISRFFAARSNN
jgi:hypothetical protein